jgi:ABC-type polysaccharide/polyol phosphate transport system ATPase subunit
MTMRSIHDTSYLEIKNGNLLLPLTGLDNRFFSKENLSRAVGGIAKTVGGRVVSSNGHKYVHCLKDINIKLNSGDRLGLIGHNGSGKTTLLKAFSGIYPLGSGEVDIHGTVSTFISQGLGMSPEMTAVDYLEMQCVIRDYNKIQIKQFVDEVLEFIELGEFAYAPIRTYSSGMRARLFASAALFFPCDILLIDEGIGAGDNQFSDKFDARMKTFFEAAKIMVLATHNRELMQEWCNKALVMKKGEIIFAGSVQDALEFYEREYEES